jgi:hypothetical protein
LLRPDRTNVMQLRVITRVYSKRVSIPRPAATGRRDDVYTFFAKVYSPRPSTPSHSSPSLRERGVWKFRDVSELYIPCSVVILLYERDGLSGPKTTGDFLEEFMRRLKTLGSRHVRVLLAECIRHVDQVGGRRGLKIGTEASYGSSACQLSPSQDGFLTSGFKHARVHTKLAPLITLR